LPAPLAVLLASDQALVMHTCQRTVVLAAEPELLRRSLRQLDAGACTSLYANAAAYEFLLQLACGLQSRLSGETEIFGQIKQCWQEFSRRDSALVQQFEHTMQRLFRDVKQLRSQFLSGIGSASYGSLVRRLLDGANKTPAARHPVLLLGAGQIAHAVAPWLKGSELWIWNRSPARARELAVELQRRAPGRVIKVLESGVDAELAAWRAAADVVVCVPADAERDAERAAAWAEARAPRGRLIHLGLDAAGEVLAWAGADDMLDLAAVYELLQASNEQRRLQLERARVACGAMASLWSPHPARLKARKRSPAAPADRLHS
jgi:glutamyl-tRNA reductase